MRIVSSGCASLAAGFLPTIERFGKAIQLLFSPSDIHLVFHDSSVGVCVIARFSTV